MSVQEFSLVVELFSHPSAPALLQDVTAQVLAFAACHPDRAAAKVEALRAAMGQLGDAGGPARLEFDGGRGGLTMTLTAGGRPVWRSTCPVS